MKKKSNSSFGNTVNNTPTDTTPIEVKKDIQEVNAKRYILHYKGCF